METVVVIKSFLDQLIDENRRLRGLIYGMHLADEDAWEQSKQVADECEAEANEVRTD